MERDNSIGLKTRVERKHFLKRVRELYPIRRIYYPGSGDDLDSLEGPFNQQEIFYLNDVLYNAFRINPRLEGEEVKIGKWIFEPTGLRKKSKGRHVFYASYSKPPFKDDVFDAVFIQDPHFENEEDLVKIMQTLKPSGILIYSTASCFNADILSALREKPDLVELVDLPFSNDTYIAFRKKQAETPQEV